MPFEIRFTAVIWISLLFGLPTAEAFGQQFPKGPASGDSTTVPQVKISAEAVDLGFEPKTLKSIDEQIAPLVDSQKIVGCNALIIKDEQEVFYGQWGQRNRERGEPLTRDTIFRIYSMSKPITSIATMQLVERGKIDLDVPVSDYLPEFQDLKVLENQEGELVEVAPKRPMTTRDLLRHTSGLTYGFFGNTEVDKRYRKVGMLVLERDIEATVTKLSKIPLLNHPGSKFVYSASTDVLGRLVEVASGIPFDRYLSENIFQPLKMEDTFFTVPSDKQDRFAQLYQPAGTGKLKASNAMKSIRFVNQGNEYFSGGGGLCSTIDDYAKFCKMLLNEGRDEESQIIKPETLKQMFTNQLTKIDQPPGRFKFGLGFAISPRGDFSWGGAAGTRFWVNPEKRLAVLFMIQIQPYGPRKYGDIVLDAAHSALK